MQNIVIVTTIIILITMLIIIIKNNYYTSLWLMMTVGIIIRVWQNKSHPTLSIHLILNCAVDWFHPACRRYLSGFLDSGHTRNWSREVSKDCGTSSLVSEKFLRKGKTVGVLSTNGNFIPYRRIRSFTVDTLTKTLRNMTKVAEQIFGSGNRKPISRIV